MKNSTAARHIAIARLRIEIRGGNDARSTQQLGARPGNPAAAEPAVLDSSRERPLTTRVDAGSRRS